MTLRVRLTRRLFWSRLVSVPICLCVFAFLPFHDLAALSCAEVSEGGSPCHDHEECNDREQTDWSRSRRRLNDLPEDSRKPPPKCGARQKQLSRHAVPFQATIGHQLANGLRAPLLL
jgi:hypothetical protein